MNNPAILSVLGLLLTAVPAFAQSIYEPYSFTTLAGLPGSAGSVDGTGAAARFDGLSSLAVDNAGNLYVADTMNQTIRKVTPAAAATTLAGRVGTEGSANGTGIAARFSFPSGVALDGAGNVYVADTGNSTIRKVTPAGVVTTFAGLAGNGGYKDGTGSAAQFLSPNGVAVDNAGNIYVADTSNHTIRKVTPSRVVTTLAGLAGVAGSADGTGNVARFQHPTGVAVDLLGNVFVADFDNHTIRKITPAGVVTTFAGQAGTAGSADGPSFRAQFNLPSSLVVDNVGNVYVADYGNNIIRTIIKPFGVVMTLAGQSGSVGNADGTGPGARFSSPFGVAVDGVGNLYVADSANHTIRKGAASGAVVNPPSITTQPSSQTVVAGGTARFNVVVAGSGPFTYQWQRNGVLIPGGVNSSLTLTNAQLLDAASYTVTVSNGSTVTSAPATLSVKRPYAFTNTGAMINARSFFTATLLSNGKVLVAGGSVNSGSGISSAELYDSASGKWEPTGSMNTARYSHTATLLPDGKVLVTGGKNAEQVFPNPPQAIGISEIYDPESGKWALTGPMTTARLYHTASLLPDGKVLVAGGQVDFTWLSSAEVYDPATGTWTATEPMTTQRTTHTASVLLNGKVLVVGGSGNRALYDLASAELYDTVTRRWTATGMLAHEREAHTATLLPDGRVLVTGGSVGATSLGTSELYDPATGVWSLTSALADARTGHTATLLPSGHVLVAGGFDVSSFVSLYFSSAEIFVPVTRAWSGADPLVAARYGHSTILLTNGMVLIAGGEDSNGRSLASAEVYGPVIGVVTPAIAAQPQSLTVIEGSDARFSVTPVASGPLSYQWQKNGVAIVGATASTLVLTNAQSTDAGRYIVSVSSSTDSIISAAATLTVTRAVVNSPPTVAVTNPTYDTVFNQGTNVTITAIASDSDGSVTNVSFFSGTTLLGHAASPPYSLTWSNVPAGSFTVTARATDDRGASTDSDPVRIIVRLSSSPAKAGAFVGTGSMANARAQHTATLLPDGRLLIAGGYLVDASVTYLSSVELYDPTSGIWTPTGSMSIPRAGHTATLLSDGKVLVAAGVSVDLTESSSAEVWDPETGRWSPTASMVSPRTSHTAALLPSGKVLVTGGGYVLGGSVFVQSSAEVYDPATRTWTATASMLNARMAHTTTSLPDGKVLVVGGTSSKFTPSSDAEVYDPAVEKWTVTGSMTLPREHHTATLLLDGKVLVAGGNGGFSTADTFDPRTGQWTPTGNLNIGREFHTATLLLNGVVLVAGGGSGISSAEIYDPATAMWSVTDALNTGRTFHTATLLPNGKVLVAGGLHNRSSRGSIFTLSSTETYDLSATALWTTTGGLNTARGSHTATLLPSGKVLVAGGKDLASTTAELYDPNTRTWQATGKLNRPRVFHTATLLPNGKVLVVGGQDSLFSAELYNPATGQWLLTTAPHYGRSGHTATLLLNGDVLVLGGPPEIYSPTSGSWRETGGLENMGGGHTATLLPNGRVLVAAGDSSWLYDPAVGTWTDTGRMSYIRVSHTATLLPSGKVLVAGGTGSDSNAELYDPVTETWTQTGSMIDFRTFHTATLLPDGKVLVAAGLDGLSPLSSAEIYDPATGSWIATSALKAVRGYHTATFLPDGNVLVVGGLISKDEFRTTQNLADAELYGQAGVINVPLSVRLTTPIPGALFNQGVNLTISAAAHDGGGFVTNVSFFNGTNFLGEAMAPPYSFTWSNLSIGMFTLTARATDNQGLSTVSAPVQITVVAGSNASPTVSLTAPTNGATFNEGGHLTLSATASDSDGSVTNVSFFSGTTLLGQATSPPYSVIWTNLNSGAFTLTARATDDRGLTTVSAPVQITVVVPTPGTKKWEFATGGNLMSSPAIAADGTVFVGSGNTNKIYALDGATGAKKWEFATGYWVHASPAIGADGTVYVGSADHKLYALDGATGAKKWEFVTGGGVISSPAIGADGMVYVGSYDKKIYALDGATGAKKWEFVTGNYVESSPAIGADGTVYVGSYDKKIYALDGATGAKKWEFATGDQVYSSPAIGADGTVYVGSDDSKIYALDGATGAMKWEFETGYWVQASPAIGADGTVYVGSRDNKVYALDGDTGTKKWEFAAGDKVYSSPAIGADGTVYVGSLDGKIYALFGSSPLADSPWPMRGNNARHTGRAPTCVPPPSGLVSWWPGEGNPNDAMGGNNGTLQTGATFTPGEVGQSFSFDGTNGFVDLGGNSSMRQSSAITYSFWANIPAGGGGQAMGAGAAGGNGFGGIFLDTLNFIFRWTPSAPRVDANVAAQGIDLQPDKWVHLAIAIDFANQTQAMYLNGQPLQTTVSNFLNQAIGSWIPAGAYDADKTDAIGGRFVNSWSYFNGSLDEVQIYNRALSAFEINGIFSAGSAGTCSAALILPLQIVTAGPVFGFHDGQFGFSITGPAGRLVVLDASTDLVKWLPIWTNTFAGALNFSDPESGVYSNRFYRTHLP